MSIFGIDYRGSSPFRHSSPTGGWALENMYYEYLTIGVILFILGVLGIVLNRSNIIIMLMCIELMLLAISFLFLINSIAIDNITGQVFTIMILTIAAAESAIGLAILVAYYRIRGTIAVKTLNLLRG